MALAKPKLFAPPGLTTEQVEETKAMLERAGYRDLCAVERDVGRQVMTIRAMK